MWKDLTISQKGDIIKMSLQNGIKGLDEIKKFYDETAHKFDDGGDIFVEGYPLVSARKEGLRKYFKNNPNVAGMAIGAGLNGIDGERRVVLNPNLKGFDNKNSVYLNESYRHFFDANNTQLPEITEIQKDAYKRTSYEGLDKRIMETEAARYLSGDPSHNLTPEQMHQLNKFKFVYPNNKKKFDDGGYRNNMYKGYNPKLFLFSEQNNSFPNAGQQVASIENSAVKMEKYGNPNSHYNNTISEQEANLRGFFPDARGHRDDRVKKENHPTHPSRGQFNGLHEYKLSDKGMENPNYTLFGVVDGNQDPQAVLTYDNSIVLPEITITPKGAYIDNTYDNIKYHIGNYVQTK